MIQGAGLALSSINRAYHFHRFPIILTAFGHFTGMPFVGRREEVEADDVRQGVHRKEWKRGFRAMHKIRGSLAPGRQNNLGNVEYNVQPLRLQASTL